MCNTFAIFFEKRKPAHVISTEAGRAINVKIPRTNVEKKSSDTHKYKSFMEWHTSENPPRLLDGGGTD